ncbi:carbamate kinase [Spiroplasma endosymbiont of Labia minor]|uniref:carbamate kinase n=1 Tax=Spiroplasma endosymbiont of Labia minor TaxID=3066305 RepID=UPI0030D4F494
MAKIVVAVGGNALGNNPVEQKEIVKITAKNLVDFIQNGDQLAIVHGNGPQVGMINSAFETSSKIDEKIPSMPFSEAGSMSQGYIGYHMVQAMDAEISKRKLNASVAALITQTVVDINDAGFKNPTKPIGAFYTKDEADKLKKINPDWTIVEDAGRGYRRVIASPKPIEIIEANAIKALMDAKITPIAVGGGGIPVIKSANGQLEGKAAVIDKDLGAALLAATIGAEKLIILTAVDTVMINYKKENQTALTNMTLNDVEKYIAEGQFAVGSMLPKIEAAASFVKANPTKIAIIGSLEKVADVLTGKSGTIIKAK